MTYMPESSRRRFDELKREDTPLRVAMLPPSVIVEGPADEKRWGRYQFPTMHRLADGRLRSRKPAGRNVPRARP